MLCQCMLCVMLCMLCLVFVAALSLPHPAYTPPPAVASCAPGVPSLVSRDRGPCALRVVLLLLQYACALCAIPYYYYYYSRRWPGSRAPCVLTYYYYSMLW